MAITSKSTAPCAQARSLVATASITRLRRHRKFTPVTRQLCLQHHACGFGYKKISKATGIPISTIKYHIRKDKRHDGINTGGTSGEGEGALQNQNISATVSAFVKSSILVDMLHAVHDVMKVNVYALARALQYDVHGAPGMMRTADPEMLTSALVLLLQDPWADRHELARLGRLLLQRLHAARNFLKSTLSLCQQQQQTLPAGDQKCSSTAATAKVTYWECPVCRKRLIHTGKCAHLTRCLKKCTVLLTHEQLHAARAKATARMSCTSDGKEELKRQMKAALTALKPDEKARQVRYMQLVVAVNSALEQAIAADPTAILTSAEAWRALKSGPNPVIAALALVSVVLHDSSAASIGAIKSKNALVRQFACELQLKVAAMIGRVETFLVQCVAVVDAQFPEQAHCDVNAVQENLGALGAAMRAPKPPSCTCHRVRISALIHYDAASRAV
uniref:Uncharacterized protein n=1 Tax=Globisporangium ultimum (strain ATCC 200006 / CBS 805.95 / DAOM BR144) TaxID=431595 RepID=K3WEV4_GLOUD